MGEVLMRTKQGVDAYSDEWMELYADDVPGPLWEYTKSLCRAFYLDEKSPKFVGYFLEQDFKTQLRQEHVLESGIRVSPTRIEFAKDVGWRYVGEVVSDDREPREIVYLPEAISMVVRR